MTSTAAAWMVVLAALVAANLPFVNERLMAVWPRSTHSPKPWYTRLFELVLFYLVVGAVGLTLEYREGQLAPQTWEFYAVTATMFLTLAFPGFVYRYLLRHR
jgi:Protein of unknown function (DUF2818)